MVGDRRGDLGNSEAQLEEERVDRGWDGGDAVVTEQRLCRPVDVALVGDAGGEVRFHRLVAGTEDAVEILVDCQQLDVVAEVGRHNTCGRGRIGRRDRQHMSCEAGDEAVVTDLQYGYPVGADHLLIDEADEAARIDREARILGLRNGADVAGPVLTAVIGPAQVQCRIGCAGSGHVGDVNAVGIVGVNRDSEVRSVTIVAEGRILEVRVIPRVGNPGRDPHARLTIAGIEQSLERWGRGAPVEVLHNHDVAQIGWRGDRPVITVERAVDRAVAVDCGARRRHVEGKAHVERGRGGSWRRRRGIERTR